MRQALDAARFFSDDTKVHMQIMREIMHAAAEINFSQSPLVIGQQIHRNLRKITGVADPYRAVKDKFNRMAMEMLPELSDMVERSPDSLMMAARLAIAGNVIDFGVDGGITVEQARKAIMNTMNEPFCGDIEKFRNAVGSARKILYLADNAGEIVFDKLLIEQLPIDCVTVAVRGYPVLNDATLEDAKFAGLQELARVIENGSDAPGTLRGDCSNEFRCIFSDADLIISKGQGNFETLSDENANIIFLFKAKCRVIADYAGVPLGTHVLKFAKKFELKNEPQLEACI